MELIIVNIVSSGVVLLNIVLSIFLLIKIKRLIERAYEQEKDRFDLIGKIKKEKNRLINKNYELINKINEIEFPELKREKEHISIDNLDEEYINSITNSFEIINYLLEETKNIRQIYGNKRLPVELEELLKKIYLNIREIL